MKLIPVFCTQVTLPFLTEPVTLIVAVPVVQEKKEEADRVGRRKHRHLTRFNLKILNLILQAEKMNYLFLVRIVSGFIDLAEVRSLVDKFKLPVVRIFHGLIFFFLSLKDIPQETDEETQTESSCSSCSSGTEGSSSCSSSEVDLGGDGGSSSDDDDSTNEGDSPPEHALEPLDLVWAKCRGYPWYPALVCLGLIISECFLPEIDKSIRNI